MALPARPPALSVIMSVYNNAPYLDAAIRSVRTQRFADFEFLIADDGSTDGSGAILAQHAQEDGRISLFSHPNRGAAAARNGLITKARAPLPAVAAMRCVFAGLWLIIHGPQMRAVVAFKWGRMARVYALSAIATLAAILPAALTLFFIAPAQISFGVLTLIALAGAGLWLLALLALPHPLGEAIQIAAGRAFGRQLRI
ncbi:MAG: glycosyltransferase family 2 protein [Chakrabartia sp.]